jgi:arylsulfatase A-like enzyme
LEVSGRLDDTLILFASDNGPEGGQIYAPEGVSATEALEILGIDNSLENLGTATSYTGYGPGWAQACSAPSWLMKGFTTQGGIRTPAFASGWGVAGAKISSAFLHVTDIAPTLLAAAGLAQPETFKGRSIIPHQGRDLLPLLANDTDAVRDDGDSVGWELFNERAIRRGPWKAVYIAPGRSRDLTANDLKAQGSGKWRLFNIADDPGEMNDLSDIEPSRLAALLNDWTVYARDNGVVALHDGGTGSTLRQKP